MGEEAIVLYPAPPIGHLVSMVELGKTILSKNPSLSIHIILVPPPYQPESTATYISSVSSSFPSITFHHLPAVTPYSSSFTSRHHHESLLLEILCFSNPSVHRTLFSLSRNFNVRAMIIDFFCTAVLDITADFTFPVYYFFTSGAACLAFSFYLPTIHETTPGKNLKDIPTLNIPGVPPMKGSDMPKAVLERDDEVYDVFIMFGKQLPKSSGIIINTFDALENRAIKAITEELCVPMVAWPLYAEQRFNRVMIVDEIKIAISMNESETGFVSSTEVEKRVQEIIGECPVRERTMAMKNAAELALTETVRKSEVFVLVNTTRVMILNEIKIAIPMDESDMGFVSSTEVVNRDREVLLDGPVRKKTKERSRISLGRNRFISCRVDYVTPQSWSPKCS
ncbi:unnamed protein product [Arabidopsis thaliana]|uniref:(thale cress) hypothetical protein n=1 Tax=Arabidopsis thaliana TaxID=3702 RepID=A0A7G2EMG7_ARATH|nr:unnamed protein product [Arabidopsis thaliana]